MTLICLRLKYPENGKRNTWLFSTYVNKNTSNYYNKTIL